MTDEVARALIERMDVMIAWQAKISAQMDAQSQQLEGSYLEQQGKIQSLLDLFASLGLPSSPQLTRELTVNAATATLLYRNDSLPFRRIEITNDDPAQPIWVGKRNVTTQLGRVQIAQTTEPYVLPQGDELWAICVVATLSVRISESYDLLGMTQIARPPELEQEP